MAVIFDLDGLLIDSEPLWQQAETQVFQSLGLNFNTDMATQTTGMRCDKVVEYWYQRQPWANPDFKAVEAQIVDTVCTLFLAKGEPMPYAQQALEQANRFCGKVALATSTPQKLMQAVIDKFDWHTLFNACCSAEQLPYPKPHPQIYLQAAQALGTPANRCIALEDSLPGMIAAKAASMKLIAVPHQDQHHPGMAIADQHLVSLQHVNVDLLETLLSDGH